MKIKVQEMDYEKVKALPKKKRILPKRPNAFWKRTCKLLSVPELRKVHFSYKPQGMEKLGAEEPALFLMNHSSFIDLKIAFELIYPRPLNIVCTSDGFVGKEGLMRNIGCIPTRKFLMDVSLVKDMKYALDTLKNSVLMYPEASYSFDGTATPLPDSLGKCLKVLGVPVVMIRTYGAFARDPLYNNLQLRDVKISAKMTYLLSPEDIKEKSVAELNAILKEQFSFDNFKWQQDNKVEVKEAFRADGLNRVLYKCPHCKEEGKMLGKGIKITCGGCGREWELTELGALSSPEKEAYFTHIPDWYAWERECVKQELTDGTYELKLPVDIYMLVDMECVYKVGSGELSHGTEGFELVGCEDRLKVRLTPEESYSLYADYFWYEIGDMICIGDKEALYYCFPKVEGDFVAKTRLATEELYKLRKKH